MKKAWIFSSGILLFLFISTADTHAEFTMHTYMYSHADSSGAEATAYTTLPWGYIDLYLEIERMDGGSTPDWDYDSGYGYVSLTVRNSSQPPPYTLYRSEAYAEGWVEDYGYVTPNWEFDYATTPGPSLIITDASIPGDRIGVTIMPFGGCGILTLTLEGTSSHSLVQNDYCGGYYNFSFNIPNLLVAAGQEFTHVHAVWEPNGYSVQNNLYYHFKVLGMYQHTMYNTPSESACSGSTQANFNYTQGIGSDKCTNVANCSYQVGSGKATFLAQFNLNSSGLSQNYGMLSKEWNCTQVPTLRVRRVDQPCPSCQNVPLISGQSVAFNPSNENLTCGASVYIHFPNGGVVVTVADTGSFATKTRLDHYVGVSPVCDTNSGTKPNALTIRLY